MMQKKIQLKVFSEVKKIEYAIITFPLGKSAL